MSESVYKKSPGTSRHTQVADKMQWPHERARALAVKPFFQACWFTASTECYPFGMAIKRPVNSEAQYKLPMTAKIHPRCVPKVRLARQVIRVRAHEAPLRLSFAHRSPPSHSCTTASHSLPTAPHSNDPPAGGTGSSCCCCCCCWPSCCACPSPLDPVTPAPSSPSCMTASSCLSALAPSWVAGCCWGCWEGAWGCSVAGAAVGTVTPAPPARPPAPPLLTICVYKATQGNQALKTRVSGDPCASCQTASTPAAHHLRRTKQHRATRG
eukprot:1154496-Pelagomonas_calceolata.AAC.2